MFSGILEILREERIEKRISHANSSPAKPDEASFIRCQLPFDILRVAKEEAEV